MNDKEFPINTPTSILSVIPQVFYDFIARLIPGSLILIFSFVCFHGSLYSAFNSIPSNYKLPPTFLIFCSFIVVSYGIAIILWQQFYWISLIFNNKRRKKRYYLTRITSYIYDYIKIIDYSVGARITKLRAEINMTETLIAGIIYCFIFNTIKLIKTDQTLLVSRSIIEVLLILFILSLFVARSYFFKRVNNALYNYYILFDGQKFKKVFKKIKKLDVIISNLKSINDYNELQEKLTSNI